MARLNPAQYEPSVVFANALTREVNIRQMRDRAQKLSTIEIRIKDMDRMGIDMQVVSPAPNQTYYWTEPELGASLARSVNDRLAEIVSTWPDRFVAFGTVPLQNVDLALAELERCQKQLGLRGVEINPSVNGMDLTDPRLSLEKFFARAQALDAVIFMHPIGFTQGERLVDHYFNNVIGNPHGDDDRGEPPHLRRSDAAKPEAQGRSAACGWLSGALLGAHGPCAPRATGLPDRDQASAIELPQENVLRHDQL